MLGILETLDRKLELAIGRLHLRIGGVLVRQHVRGIASRLKVPEGTPEGTPVWEIRGLRLADDKPMELNYVYIPVSLCPELIRKDVEHSLYAYIAKKTGILPASVDAVYEAINLDKNEAGLLGQTTGKAALRVVRSTYDKTGKPFEVGVLISCDGQAQLHVHIAANKTTFTAKAQ